MSGDANEDFVASQGDCSVSAATAAAVAAAAAKAARGSPSYPL